MATVVCIRQCDANIPSRRKTVAGKAVLVRRALHAGIEYNLPAGEAKRLTQSGHVANVKTEAAKNAVLSSAISPPTPFDELEIAEDSEVTE